MIKDNNNNRVKIENVKIENVSITINALEKIEKLLDRIILLQENEMKENKR
jgi:hypothetical protein